MACSRWAVNISANYICIHQFNGRYNLYLFSNNECLRMIAIAMVMMPMTTLALNQLPDDLIPHGTAVNNTFRQVSGSIGTAVLVTIMSTAAIPGGDVEGIIH